MSANIYAKPSGTQVALQLNGVDAVVYDSTGIVSGVNKSAVSQQATLGTAQATTSGTALDFTGIPSWVKRITIMLNGVSTSGTSPVGVQIGAGSVDVTSYNGSSANTNNSNGTGINANSTLFQVIGVPVAASTYFGSVVLTHMGGNLWAESHNIAPNSTAGQTGFGGGTHQLAGTLDRIRLTTVNGTDTFDAGSWNILYE